MYRAGGMAAGPRTIETAVIRGVTAAWVRRTVQRGGVPRNNAGRSGSRVTRGDAETAAPDDGGVDVARRRIRLPGQETLLACWRALTQLSPGARVVTFAHAVAAVFPSWAPLNNAVLFDPSDGARTAAAVSRLTGVYADAAVDGWALWLPSGATDFDAPDEVTGVAGLKRDTTTLVMRASLSGERRAHDAVLRTSIAAATCAAGDEPIPVADLPDPDRVPGLSGWVLVHDGMAVAGAWSFLHGSDCGIYTVGTLPQWRRRGFAGALTDHLLADAQRRGARTATLQSTRMGQPMYVSLGFAPVGRYEEWVSR